MDDLLRARLRLSDSANLRLKALRMTLQTLDRLHRGLTGQPFFAIRETEEILIELDGRQGTDLIDALMTRNGGTTITPKGLDHVPASGPVIIGTTHPVGTFDFIAHAGALLDHRPDLKVVANREAARFLGEDRIVPVDLNRQDKVLGPRKTMAGMARHLKDGGALLVFGSGRVADSRKGLLFEPPWRMGITRVSAETGVSIVPASADVRNSALYYRTRRTFQILSGGNEYIGREVASLRYVSELLAKLGGSYDVHYGPAVAAGTAPERLKALAEGLVPGLYRPA